MTWTTRPRSDFGALKAIRSGTGPQVLLLHGVGLRAEAWNAQIDALSKDFSVIAPDMPGHGESPRFAVTPTLADYADKLIEALEGPAFVAGHSMGAMLALDLAARKSSQTLAVAALNAIYRRTPQAAVAVRARAGSLNGVDVADPSGPLARWFGDAPSAEADACRDWLLSVDPVGYRDAYRAFANEDGPPDDALRGLTCPALFFTGMDEPNSTPAMSEAMAMVAPQGRSIAMAGAAHMMPMTHPDETTATLRAFFQESAS